MSELLNAKAAGIFQLPETKFQAGNLIQFKDIWKPGSSQSIFENYLKTAARGPEESFREKNRGIREERPIDRDQKLNQLREMKDDSAEYNRRVDRKDPDRNSSSAKMNQAHDQLEKDDMSSKATDKPEIPETGSKAGDSQTEGNVINQAIACLNPEIAQLVSGEQPLVTGVVASEAVASDLNLVALTSIMGEQANQDSQNNANQQVQNLQGMITDQNTAILAGDSVTQVMQTAATPNQTLSEAGTLLTGSETKKADNNSKEPVVVIDATVNSKENTATPFEPLNSAVLKAFQNIVAERAAIQNVSHNKDELQQNLQNGMASGKAGAVTGEGKPLNVAVLQTQLAIGENPDKVQMIPSMQLQQQHVSSGQLQEMAATNTQFVGKDHLFGQIVENAKLMLAGGHSEMEINLKPEHLGKLQLKIALENQVVTARFVAESQQVKEIIETNLNQLREHLKENGLQIENLSVSVGTGTFEQNYNQTANSQRESGTFKDSNGFFGTQNESEAQAESAPSPKSLQETAIDLIA